MNAYGYDYIHTAPAIGVVCCHISVGFQLFILLIRQCEGLYW